MPVAITQAVYPPYAGQPIDEAWGDATAESVIQNFSSTASRNTNWTSPPEGGLSSVNGRLWARLNSVWKPQSIIADHYSMARTVGNYQPGLQGFVEPITFKPCPYDCTILLTLDAYLGYAIWNGDMEIYIVTNRDQPGWAGQWSQRCSIIHGLSPAAWASQSTQQVLYDYTEGSSIYTNAQFNFTTGNLYFNFHMTAVYLPSKMVSM